MELNSLDDVRINIDRLDREIISLMAERGTFVRQAARFKTSLTDVDAPKRVEQVIDKVREQATGKGLDPQIAEATYRAMIDAFIEFERSVFHRK